MHGAPECTRVEAGASHTRFPAGTASPAVETRGGVLGKRVLAAPPSAFRACLVGHGGRMLWPGPHGVPLPQKEGFVHQGRQAVRETGPQVRCSAPGCHAGFQLPPVSKTIVESVRGPLSNCRPGGGCKTKTKHGGQGLNLGLT